MKTIHLPELADLSAQELEKIIEKVNDQPESEAKQSLTFKLAALKQMAEIKTFTRAISVRL